MTASSDSMRRLRAGNPARRAGRPADGAADRRAATQPPDWWGSRRGARDTPTRGYGTIRFVRSSVVAAFAASWRRVRRDSLYPYAPGRVGAVCRYGRKALPEGAA